MRKSTLPTLILFLAFLICIYSLSLLANDGTIIYLPIVVKMNSDSVEITTPTPTFTPTPSPTNTSTLTPLPTNTPTDSPTPTITPTPTATPCGTLSGILVESVTLTEDCSYVITGNLLISENITLTIPAGAKLRFEPITYMKVEGSLQAIGTEEKPVTFTRNQTGQQSSIGSWDGIQITEKSGSKSELIHTIFEYASYSSYYCCKIYALLIDSSAPILSNLTFQYNKWPLMITAQTGVTVTVESSTFVGNEGATFINGSKVIINNSLFERNLDDNSVGGVVRACSGEIINNRFVDNATLAIIQLDSTPCSSLLIEHNYFEKNKGVFLHANRRYPVIFRYNDLRDNTSIKKTVYYPGTTAPLGLNCLSKVNFNNYYSKQSTHSAQVIVTRDCEIDARNNWWGSTNAGEIDAMIYDYFDDFELGRIVYDPFLEAPLPDTRNERTP